MRRLLLFAFLVLSVGLNAQTQAAGAYQAIPANTIPTVGPAEQTNLPVPLPSQPIPAAAPALPSVDNARPLNSNFAQNLTTLIPLQLPGYELRVMDVTKRVTFQVDGQPVAADVPIFVYMPKESAPKAAAVTPETTKELRKLYNDLIGIYNQETVNKEQVRAMLKRLDAAIDAMERGSVPLTSAAAE